MAGASLLQKWQLLQAVIADASLSATAKVVAARVLDYFHTQTGRCCPSYQALADGTGLKRRAIIYAIQELEKAGWIAIDRVKGGAASGSNRYATNSIRLDFSRAGSGGSTVHGDAPSRVHDGAPSSVQDDAPLTVHDDALSQVGNSARDEGVRVHGDAPSTVHGGAPESGNITGKESGKSLPHTPSCFDEWWSSYPRRDGKIAARRAYDRAIGRGLATHDELVAGARRYAEARAGQDPKFTKVPTTWLNGGHWADEPIPAGAGRSESGSDRGGRRPSGFSATRDWLMAEVDSDG